MRVKQTCDVRRVLSNSRFCTRSAIEWCQNVDRNAEHLVQLLRARCHRSIPSCACALQHHVAAICQGGHAASGFVVEHVPSSHGIQYMHASTALPSTVSVPGCGHEAVTIFLQRATINQRQHHPSSTHQSVHLGAGQANPDNQKVVLWSCTAVCWPHPTPI